MTLAPPILPVPRERLGPAPSPRRSTGNRGAGLLLAVGVLFGLTLAWPLLAHWAGEYAQPDSYYAYGPLIPFLAALMLWRRRERLPRARPCLGALAALLPATGLLVVATKLQMPALMSLGFLGAVWSSAWLLRGTAWVRAARVPLLFLLWMAPLPGPLLNDATFDAQGWSTRAGRRRAAPAFVPHDSERQRHRSGHLLVVRGRALFRPEGAADAGDVRLGLCRAGGRPRPAPPEPCPGQRAAGGLRQRGAAGDAGAGR